LVTFNLNYYNDNPNDKNSQAKYRLVRSLDINKNGQILGGGKICL